jgi:predicted ABC-type ATPase
MAKKRSSPKSREPRSEPEMRIVAGPNGAGKSTYLAAAVFEGEVIRPDEIAIALAPDAPESAALRAGRVTVARMRDCLRGGRSFAVETTLSGRLHLAFAKEAKRRGWQINLVYIGLRTEELAIERVRQRAASGGHSVPPADIRRRYHRSMANLYEILRLADEAIVLDNSTRGRPRRLATWRHGRPTYLARRLPDWLNLNVR